MINLIVTSESDVLFRKQEASSGTETVGDDKAPKAIFTSVRYVTGLCSSVNWL